jgi:adsorption protein B
MVPEWLALSPVCCLVVWVVLSGTDDLFLQLVFLYLRVRETRGPATASRAPARSRRYRRIAVFVPLWREHDVIVPMLEHNLAAVRYTCYDFFVGVYPNDPATCAAAAEAAARYPNVHVAVCPHPGPTSKADCLNAIYEYMVSWEALRGARFDAVVTHDAEDLMHPESLETIDACLDSADMVQIPVLPLPTPPGEWTHGLYCDEFAEYQTRDVIVRQALGGFIAGCGVGTGFSRLALEKLAATWGSAFDASCLTEDYETGFRIRQLGLPQVFVTLRGPASSPVATREYFPRTFSAAVRQRTRWMTGIALQGWERHGWRVPGRQLYWLWRDRKSLVGNLLAPALNLIFLWGAAAAAAESLAGVRWSVPLRDTPWLAPLCGFTLAISGVQMLVRAVSVGRIYGLRMALGVPLRAVFGNFLNGAATARALWRYGAARLWGRPLPWLKTEHKYPGRAVLMRHKRRLGEILCHMGAVTEAGISFALGSLLPGERLGECLVRAGMVREERIYEALALQHGLPLVTPHGISRRAAAMLPAGVARKWHVVPVLERDGMLFVAGTEPPSDEMIGELERSAGLRIRFQFVTPLDFARLLRAYRGVRHITARTSPAVRTR